MKSKQLLKTFREVFNRLLNNYFFENETSSEMPYLWGITLLMYVFFYCFMVLLCLLLRAGCTKK